MGWGASGARRALSSPLRGPKRVGSVLHARTLRLAAPPCWRANVSRVTPARMAGHAHPALQASISQRQVPSTVRVAHRELPRTATTAPAAATTPTPSSTRPPHSVASRGSIPALMANVEALHRPPRRLALQLLLPPRTNPPHSRVVRWRQARQSLAMRAGGWVGAHPRRVWGHVGSGT
jgi:hypothetical protein